KNTLSKITRLRQICLAPAMLDGRGKSAKLDALRDIVEDVRDRQFLIFTCFRQFVPFIAMVLNDLGISHGEIVGGQSTAARNETIKLLNSGEIQSIIGTVRSMGEGLNLQKAQVAIFTDIDWVPAVNHQAAGRIHRGEIKESPTIIRL